MALLGSQDLEEVGKKERHWVGVSGSGCLTRQVPGSRLGCPSPATQASPRGEGVRHQVTRKVASRRCGMVVTHRIKTVFHCRIKSVLFLVGFQADFQIYVIFGFQNHRSFSHFAMRILENILPMAS